MKWIMDIIALISNLASATAKLFGFAQERSELKNAPDVKQAAKAQQEQKELDQEIKDVAARDAEAVRKDLAE